MSTQENILRRVLQENSRTFAIPIMRLPNKLRESILLAYLCMRGLDEIEDHAALDNPTKVLLLRQISANLQAYPFSKSNSKPKSLEAIFSPYKSKLPEVTIKMDKWLSSLPLEIAPRIVDATSSMADRMAFWAERNWLIENEADLNGYTFSVAGTVGLLICDIWAWFEGTQLDRSCAVNFGRALQSVNILRNREDDIQRKVDFYPVGWGKKEVLLYARRQVDYVKSGIGSIPGNAYQFLVRIPLTLAEATLDAIERGEKKLTRDQVLSITAQE